MTAFSKKGPAYKKIYADDQQKIELSVSIKGHLRVTEGEQGEKIYDRVEKNEDIWKIEEKSKSWHAIDSIRSDYRIQRGKNDADKWNNCYRILKKGGSDWMYFKRKNRRGSSG